MSGNPVHVDNDNSAYNRALQEIRDAAALSATSIDLSSRRLTSLPPEIARLTSLTKLDLRSNQLTWLPPEIGQLESLRRVGVADNPLKDPPPEVVRQGTEAILAYLKAKARMSR